MSPNPRTFMEGNNCLRLSPRSQGRFCIFSKCPEPQRITVRVFDDRVYRATLACTLLAIL